MDSFEWLIISYYGTRLKRGLYKIHALLRGKAVTTDFKQIHSEGTFSGNQ